MSALGGGAEDTAKGVFDASQYAFFSLSGPGGAAGLGEEELGGLDDDDDDDAGLGLEEEGIGESEELGGLEDEDEDEVRLRLSNPRPLQPSLCPVEAGPSPCLGFPIGAPPRPILASTVGGLFEWLMRSVSHSRAWFAAWSH